MQRLGLYVDLPGEELRWQVKRAALDARKTVRALVLSILKEWLTVHGYATPTSQSVVGIQATPDRS
jgi:hypothetical protein